MIRLVTCDLDGTIINRKNQCSPKTVETIKRIRKMGIRFAICTGRPIDSMLQCLKMWNLEGQVDYVVGSNGGEILDLAKNKHVITYSLKRDLVLEMLDTYQELPVIPTLYDGEILYVQETSDFTKNICDSVGVIEKQGNIREILPDEIIKMMFIVKPEDMEQVEAFYQTHLDPRYVGFKTAPVLFELTHPLIAKDIGVSMIATMMQISLDQVIAFGDTTNDIEMLKCVKYGIAMENGSEDAKQVAYGICPSVDEDGFTAYLDEHLQTAEFQ